MISEISKVVKSIPLVTDSLTTISFSLFSQVGIAVLIIIGSDLDSIVLITGSDLSTLLFPKTYPTNTLNTNNIVTKKRITTPIAIDMFIKYLSLVLNEL